MSTFYFVYRVVGWPIIAVMFRVLALFIPKVREGLRARSPSVAGGSPWASAPAFPGSLWIHCASGEFEYAKPVITLLKKENSSRKILVTYFSTSYRKALASFPGVDLYMPLPWDTPRALQEFLSYHKPSQLLIARTDVWPEMARQARRAKLPSLLFSATLTAQSGRARGIGRWASRATFSNLDSIFAVSDEDTAVFQSLNLEGTKVVKAGDTRYDQVLARLASPKPLKESLFTSETNFPVTEHHEPAIPPASSHALSSASQTKHGPIVVCGSTWPEDEAVLIPAIAKLKLQARFILVPHESTEDHLTAIEAQLAAAGLRSARYSTAEAWTEGVLIVDVMGILAELYLKADYAFVGGSFKKNIHSVMEPLAAGCLTLVGPKHANNREALALREIALADLNPALANGGKIANVGDLITTSERNRKRLTAVQPVSSSDEIIAVLEAAMNLPTEVLKAAIRGEIEARTGASRLVVDWINSAEHGRA